MANKKGLYIGFLSSVAAGLLVANLFMTKDIVDLYSGENYSKNKVLMSRKLDNITVSDLESRLFEASDIDPLQEKKYYAYKINEICSEIRNKKEFTTAGVYGKHKIVYDFLYDNFFEQGYDDLVFDLELLISKKPKGNCFSFTALYLMVSNNLGLGCDIIYFGDHIFPCFNFNEKRIDIETTEPYGDGFDCTINRNEPGQRKATVDNLVAEFYAQLGKLLVLNNNFSRAEQMLKKGINSCKTHYTNYSNLGALFVIKYGLYGSEEFLDDIVKYTKKAIKYYPYDIESHNHLAFAYIHKRNFNKAAKCLLIADSLIKKMNTDQGVKQQTEKAYALFKQKAPDFDMGSVEISNSLRKFYGI